MTGRRRSEDKGDMREAIEESEDLLGDTAELVVVVFLLGERGAKPLRSIARRGWRGKRTARAHAVQLPMRPSVEHDELLVLHQMGPLPRELADIIGLLVLGQQETIKTVVASLRDVVASVDWRVLSVRCKSL